ncbi:hypothetical protein ACOSZF_23615, partial [Cytobacillus firmus]
MFQVSMALYQSTIVSLPGTYWLILAQYSYGKITPIILFGFTIYMVVDHFCHKWINILSGVGHKDGRGGANLCPSS